MRPNGELLDKLALAENLDAVDRAPNETLLTKCLDGHNRTSLERIEVANVHVRDLRGEDVLKAESAVPFLAP